MVVGWGDRIFKKTMCLCVLNQQKMKNYQLYIGGEWTNGSTGETENIINPSDESIVGVVQVGSPEDAHKALVAAEKAQKNWRRLPARQRAD